MLYFTIEKRLQDGIGKVTEAAGARWRFYPRISSDILESSFYWRKHFREFPMKSWASRFRGRRSIWWGWRVTLVAPRIGNEVAYVTQIIDDIHFAWQAQYLVRLEGGFTCSAHWKWGFICDADHWWHSFCVAGAVFGEVGGWLHLLHALEMRFHMWRRSLMTFILRGRRSIWWGWRVTWLAPRIGNDVSYVTQIIDDIHFAWQAQYLVRLAGDFSWQAQHFVTFWEIAGTRNVVFYNTKSSPRWEE